MSDLYLVFYNTINGIKANYEICIFKPEKNKVINTSYIQKAMKESTRLDRITVDGFEIIDSNANKSMVMESCDRFVFFDDISSCWCYREYEQPRLEILNYLNKDLKIKVFVLNSTDYKKYMGISFLNYMKLIYCSDNIDVNYISDENLDDILSLGEVKNVQHVIYIEDSCTLRKLPDIYYKTQQTKFDVIAITNSAIYKLSKEPGEINLKKVFI